MSGAHYKDKPNTVYMMLDYDDVSTWRWFGVTWGSSFHST